MNDAEKNAIIEKLLKLSKREVRIEYDSCEEQFECGKSKIGGKPDTPDEFIWPYYSGKVSVSNDVKNRPLSFLAQINLSDVAKYDAEGILPHSGILSFFYELSTMTWGFDPADQGSAKVFYFPDIEVLSRASFPDDMEDDSKLPELAISFSEQISLPGYDESSFKDEVDWDDYDDCITEAGYEADEMGDRTKLLGYTDVIQSPMQEECESVTRGYRMGNSEDYDNIPENIKLDILKKADEWILLFQMGTIENDDFELMFGDCGHIYFWIKKSDLKERKFENIWLILQCS